MPAPAGGPFLLAFEGREVPASVARRLANGGAAGVTLFHDHNVGPADEVRALTDELRRATRAGPGPLVALDQEGGQLLGLGTASTPFAGNLALGAADDLDLTRRVAVAIGTELRGVGVNVAYAPVADLAVDPRNVAMGARSFGDDAERVAHHVAAFVDGLRSVGVGATLKHFPGVGDVTADTHHGAATLDRSAAELDARELVPFRAGIEAGAELVMSCHASVPQVTGHADLPATLAPDVMRTLLRTTLGFEGVTVTDAFDMAAIDQTDGIGIDAIAALRAGNDLLLLPPDETISRPVVTAVEHARARGLLDPDRLAAAEDRVGRLRRRLDDDRAPEPTVVGCVAHRRLADELAARSITLVHDRGGVLPLRTSGTVLVVQPRPTAITPADTSPAYRPELADALNGRGLHVEEMVLDHDPDRGQVDVVAAAASRVDVVVVATTQAVHQAGQRAVVEVVEASGTPAVHVALRDPADVAVVAPVGAAACTYAQHRPSLDALAAALVGAASFEGRVPVALSECDRRHGVHR